MNDDPNLDRKTAFERIYSANEWGSNESRSGLGSNLDLTHQVRRALPPLLRGLAVKSMLDAPCGDYNWMPHVDLGSTNYIGCDIVPELITANRMRHPGIEFLCVDLAEGSLVEITLEDARTIGLVPICRSSGIIPIWLKQDPKIDGAGKSPKDPKSGPNAGGTDANPASGSLHGGQPPAAEKPDRQAPGAKLSEHEARALLGGLKGEDRHPVLRTGDAGAAVDDAPRKDW